MTSICENCGGNFDRTNGTQRYCPDCLWLTLTCAHCGETFTRRRRLQERYPQRHCSLSCSTAATADSRRHRGAANNRYNGGLSFGGGRWIVCCTDGSQLLFSRAVMEAELRRPLRPDEIVHHINGDTTDDRAENLQVVTRAEHMKIHEAEIQAARRA